MTEDHSVVQSLVSAGLLSAAEAIHDPKRNVLQGAAGTDCDVGPDVSPTVAVTSGDVFLICSDGVWSMLNTQFLVQSLSASNSVQTWVNAVMDEVARIGKGHNDNFTATGVWITADGENTVALA